MIWLLVCAVGLLVETSLIVVLGRRATSELDDRGDGERGGRIRAGTR